MQSYFHKRAKMPHKLQLLCQLNIKSPSLNLDLDQRYLEKIKQKSPLIGILMIYSIFLYDYKQKSQKVNKKNIQKMKAAELKQW